MAMRPLRDLPGWRLADPSQDVRGLPVLDESGQKLGTVAELVVNTLTDFIQDVVLDTGLAFPVRKLERNGREIRVVKREQ